MAIEWNTYHTKNIKCRSLFRYMKAKWIFEFLRTGNLSMTRMDQFEDKFEGITIGNIVSLGLLHLLEKDISWNPNLTKEQIIKIKHRAKNKLITAKDQLKSIQTSNYVVCWYLADSESVAMWDLYAKEDGLAIQIDRSVLQKKVKLALSNNIFPSTVRRMVAGKVKYQNFKNVVSKQSSHTMRYISFRKDISFQHEKEYRFVLSFNSPNEIKRFNYYLGDPKKLKIKIIANPRMEEKKFAEIEQELFKIDPSFKLYKSDIRPCYKFMELDF